MKCTLTNNNTTVNTTTLFCNMLSVFFYILYTLNKLLKVVFKIWFLQYAYTMAIKHLLCHTKAQMLWISTAHKVSHHTFLVAVLVSRALLLPSIWVCVSSSRRERGQEDICFMSAGSVALGFEVIRPFSISLWSEHGPLLPEGNPPNQRANSLRRCYGERRGRTGGRLKEEEGEKL